MTKEEIYKASDVLNTILDNYLHGGESAEVVTKFEDELIKSNLTKEEHVSEDLKEACEQLAENARKHKAATSSPFFSQADYIQGLIDGSNWQMQQMMAKAVDGEVGYWNLRGLSINTDLPRSVSEGDKVKIIVIKRTDDV